VLGERRFERDLMPAARYCSNTIGNRILSAMIGVRVADSQSGFRLIRADLLRRLTLDAERYEIETEITVKLARMGARPDTVPIHPAYEGAPSKLRPVRDTVRTCMRALRYRFLEK
jgi:hypothetical protein